LSSKFLFKLTLTFFFSNIVGFGFNFLQPKIEVSAWKVKVDKKKRGSFLGRTTKSVMAVAAMFAIPNGGDGKLQQLPPVHTTCASAKDPAGLFPKGKTGATVNIPCPQSSGPQCKPANQADNQEKEKKVIAYFTNWGVYDRKYFVKNVPAGKLTHINYAFIDVRCSNKWDSAATGCANSKCGAYISDEWSDTDSPNQGMPAASGTNTANCGKNLFGPDNEQCMPEKQVWEDQKNHQAGNLEQFRQLKINHPRLKLIASLGGFKGSKYFSPCTAPGKREELVESTMQLLRDYPVFDGIDIDWEYPGSDGAAGNIIDEVNDWPNHMAYMTRLREEMNKLEIEKNRADKYEMSIAVGMGDAPLQRAEPHMKDMCGGENPLLDGVNLMTYDFNGDWSKTSGHNAPMHDSQNSDGLAPRAERYWLKHCHSDRIMWGLGMYGRSWKGIPAGGNPNMPGYNQDSTATGGGSPQAGCETYDSANLEYWDIIKNYGGAYLNDPAVNPNPDAYPYKYYYDQQNMAPYLYAKGLNGGNFITFDDDRSVRDKVAWASKKKLGGVMFWELQGDREETLLDAALETMCNKSDGVPHPIASTTRSRAFLGQEKDCIIAGARGMGALLLPFSLAVTSVLGY